MFIVESIHIVKHYFLVKSSVAGNHTVGHHLVKKGVTSAVAVPTCFIIIVVTMDIIEEVEMGAKIG